MSAWFHGTNVALAPGELIKPGYQPNFNVSRRGHVYFTPDAALATLFAIRVCELQFTGSPHVYEIEPLAVRTYRDYGSWGRPFIARWSAQPLVITREFALTPEFLESQVEPLVGLWEQ